MKTEQIIKTLQAHNDWRRDKINTTEYFDTISSHEIGLTLDSAIERLQTLKQERDESIEIARTAIGAIETIYELAQNCYDCPSFEIAKQCRNDLHGFDRLNYLEEGSE